MKGKCLNETYFSWETIIPSNFFLLFGWKQQNFLHYTSLHLDCEQSQKMLEGKLFVQIDLSSFLYRSLRPCRLHRCCDFSHKPTHRRSLSIVLIVKIRFVDEMIIRQCSASWYCARANSHIVVAAVVVVDNRFVARIVH